MDIIKDFLGSAAFWAAAVGLVNAVQLWLFPTVPANVMTAFNAFVVVLGGILAARVAQVKASVRAENARWGAIK